MKNIFEEKSSSTDRRTEEKTFADAIAETVREPVVVLFEDSEILAANNSFCSLLKYECESIAGQSFFEIGGRQWDSAEIRTLLDYDLHQRGNFRDKKIDVQFSGFEIRSFLLSGSRIEVGGGQGKKISLLSFHEVTEESQKNKNEKDYLRSYRNIVAHAPAMICTLRGPQHIFELANERYFQLTGNRDILGKPVREALPEVKNQGFFEILDEVYNSGQPFVGNEVSIQLDVGDGTLKNSFLDFLYQPTWDSEGRVDGIFVHAVDVTEQVLARKKIEEAGNKLRKLIDTVPAMIWITIASGETSYLNKNWYQYTGQSEQESEGFGWLDAIHPDDRERSRDTFLKAGAERRPFNVSFRLRNKNGQYRWVINNGSPNYDINGEYEGMIGTVVDVHEEKIKEQLIREKEHRIRSIVEEATVATAVYTGKNMRIELANDAMTRLWGKDRSVIGSTLREAIPELEGQPFHNLLEEVYTTGKTYWGKEDKVDLIIGGKLQTGFFNFTYKPLRNERGEIYGILNMALDVTETVKSKMLLKESESHFRQMADLMPDKVHTLNPDGKFLYINQGWVDYTGISSDELKIKGWTSFVHPDEKTRFIKNSKTSLQSGQKFEMEIRIADKNGKYKWHLSRAEAVRDEEGEISMWICTNTDIQKLKEEEKRKEDFLKMVSHELKTPVTSIKGYVQLLLSLLKRDGEVEISSLPLKPSLERIDHQIGRLTRLISEMLDLSRIEENKLELQKERFNINELIEETVQDINYTNTQHDIRIFHDYRCEVYADKDRLGQVLINFITNAIKYSPENQRIEVRIGKYGNDRVVVSVKDYGIGIDKKNHKNIFKRFYRIGGKNEETYSGFGIGLYLAQEIIQRHGGNVEVKSSSGRGSVFSFTLAVAKEN